MSSRQYVKYAAKHLISERLDHVLEFGVAYGKSLKIIKDELDKKVKKHELFGFDSFKGFEQDWLDPNGRVLLRKEFFSTSGKVPNIEGVKFFKGWFKDTIPEYLKIAKNIALLHVDCDLYKPALEIFHGVQDFIVKGTIIAIDDWFYEKNPKYNDTTQKAFYEWVAVSKINYKFCKFPGCENPNLGQKIVEII